MAARDQHGVGAPWGAHAPGDRANDGFQVVGKPSRKIDGLAKTILAGKDHPEVDAKEPDVKKALVFAVGAK